MLRNELGFFFFLRRLAFFNLLFVLVQSLFALKIQIPPYLQPGNIATLDYEEKMILWQTDNEDGNFKVLYSIGKKEYKEAKITFKNLPFEPYPRLYQAVLQNLDFDKTYYYKVLSNEKLIRESSFCTRTQGDHFKFVAFGCGAEGTTEQLAIAKQALLQNPLFGIYLGDFGYPGRAASYLTDSFRYYNKKKEEDTGTDLMSKVPFYFTFGNHDMGDGKGLTQYEDELASFYYFEPPHNGPAIVKEIPGLKKQLQNFTETVGKTFDFKSIYSFDVGNTHFVILDGNRWINPKNEELREWIRNDLAESKAVWKIVCMHQPPFAGWINHLPKLIGDKEISDDIARARSYVDLFQKGNVDLVLNAHIHAYERSSKILYDASSDTITSSEKGIPYIISGAAGAHLHLDTITHFASRYKYTSCIPSSYLRSSLSYLFGWSSYLEKGIYDDFSFSMIEINRNKLKFSQLNQDGKEIDTFVLRK